MRRTHRPRPLVVLLFALLGSAGAAHAVPTLQSLTQRERDDPLEPWSLEPASYPMPMPAPVPVPAPPPTSPNPNAPPLPPISGTPAMPSDDPRGGEHIEIVRCRQLLISNPQQAARLAKLLHSGVSFENAQQVLGRVEVDDRTREYALEELSPDVRAEIGALPVGSWSQPRTYRGRTALFQVLAKEERERRTLPALGAGLDANEQNRVAAMRRTVAAPQRATDETADYDKASVVTQVTPAYPDGATGAGEVTIDVDVGLSDDVIDARVVHSNSSAFEMAATDAARRSAYRSARRNGIPERGKVTLTFKFVAPQTPPPVGGGD